MEFLFADFFFSIIGWTFLLLKYRDSKKMTFVKDTKFDGLYATAGRAVAFKAFLIIVGLLVIGLAIAGIVGTISNDV